MSKRPHDSQVPLSASGDLVKRLKSAGSDTVLLREIVESSDSVSIASAFAALLDGGSSEATNDAKRRKKTRNRPLPSVPNETFVEILLFADRDTLDEMQLVCLFMRDFIRDREAKELPLRSISLVKIGGFSKPNGNNFAGNDERWLPIIEVVRDSNTGTEIFPDTVSQLVPYMRLAYCESIRIDLRWTRSVCNKHRGLAQGTVFGDLVVPTTSVNVLTVCVDEGSATAALRAFETFKPLSEVVVKVDGRYGHPDWARCFDEAFFVTAANCGVRSIKIEGGSQFGTEINALPALSFGFAEPTTGGDRSISSVYCAVDEEEEEDGNFLALLIKKASELDGRQHIDFKFSIESLVEKIDAAGFEKYRKDERTWIVDNLENGVTVEVKDAEEAEQATEIHVFSSV